MIFVGEFFTLVSCKRNSEVRGQGASISLPCSVSHRLKQSEKSKKLVLINRILIFEILCLKPTVNKDQHVNDDKSKNMSCHF